jgi:hypothetical protein
VRSVEMWLGRRAARGARGSARSADDRAVRDFDAAAEPEDAAAAEFLLRWILVGWGLADLIGTATICTLLVATDGAAAQELNVGAKAGYGFAAAIYLFHVLLVVRLGLVRRWWRATWVQWVAQPKQTDALIFLALIPPGYLAISAVFLR